jgi:hypothetical protein
MKAHLILLHKSLAAHHQRLSKAHADHADALEAVDAEDANVDFHRAASEEHADQAKFHKTQAGVIDELPEPERFGPDNIHDLHGEGGKVLVPRDPMRRAAMADDGLDGVAGAAPDNEDYKKSLAERGLRLAPRFGAPTIEEALEESAARIDPELRKAII